MDREPEGRKENDDKERTSYASVAASIDDAHQKSIAVIDDIIASRYPFGKTGAILKIEKILLKMCDENAKSSLQDIMLIGELQDRIDTLEQLVSKIVEKSNSLSSMKQEIADLKKQQIPRPIRAYINEFREEWEQFKAQRNRWFVK